MPELNWIAKDKVVKHDKELPYRVLKVNAALSVGKKSDNLIIQGDNLEALKSLMPFYYNRIKCIYIDPPYNTGNEGWKYNDKVNSPQIRAWINTVVGPEGEDLCRHDKWLCMMYPRLKLLKELLTDDGILFVSIDEHELTNLCSLLKELFGENALDMLIWRKTGKQSNTKAIRRIKTTHEYVVVAYKNKLNTRLSKVKLLPNWKNTYTNPDNDPRGTYKQGIISNKEEASRKDSPNYYAVQLPSGRIVTREWYISEDEYKRLEADNRIYIPRNGDGIPAVKIFENEEQEYYFDSVIDEMGNFSDAKDEVEKIFGDRDYFETPKPVKLIKEIIRSATREGDIILDSFAGSGTTGQAVLELNAEENTNRTFIEVELERDVAYKITAERAKRVIEGYKDARFPQGTGGSFQFLDLNGKLFNEDGFISEHAQYEDLAAYIYYTETKKHVELESISDPYIGSLGSRNYYLLFKGPEHTVLDQKTAEELSDEGKTAIIYADKCLIDDEKLNKLGVIFKQIPYEIKKY
jgi:adenine-specific DNA-methyltransferase